MQLHFLKNYNTSGAEHTQCLTLITFGVLSMNLHVCAYVTHLNSAKVAKRLGIKLTALPYIPHWGCEACSLPIIFPY